MSFSDRGFHFVPVYSGQSRAAESIMFSPLLSFANALSYTEKYHDPLIPRSGVDPHFYPQGVTLQMEKEWLTKIAATKEPRV